MDKISAEVLVGEQWAEWYALSPMERRHESENYWKYTSRPEDLLIPSPTRRVLSSIAKYQVHALLMGGQACILYGGSELTR